jgi:hypothetical protein
MTAVEALNRSHWNNIPGDIQDEIIRQVECGASHAIVSEKYMQELAIYSLQQLGYSMFHDKKNNWYKIVW